MSDTPTLDDLIATQRSLVAQMQKLHLATSNREVSLVTSAAIDKLASLEELRLIQSQR